MSSQNILPPLLARTSLVPHDGDDTEFDCACESYTGPIIIERNYSNGQSTCRYVEQPVNNPNYDKIRDFIISDIYCKEDYFTCVPYGKRGNQLSPFVTHAVSAYEIPIPLARAMIRCVSCDKTCEHYGFGYLFACTNCFFLSSYKYCEALPTRATVVPLYCCRHNVYSMMIKIPQKNAFFCFKCSRVHTAPEITVNADHAISFLLDISHFALSTRQERKMCPRKYKKQNKELDLTDPTNLFTQLDRIRDGLWDVTIYNQHYLLRKCTQLSERSPYRKKVKLYLLLIAYCRFDPRNFFKNPFIANCVSYIGTRWSLSTTHKNQRHYFAQYGESVLDCITISAPEHRLFNFFSLTATSAHLSSGTYLAISGRLKKNELKPTAITVTYLEPSDEVMFAMSGKEPRDFKLLPPQTKVKSLKTLRLEARALKDAAVVAKRKAIKDSRSKIPPTMPLPSLQVPIDLPILEFLPKTVPKTAPIEVPKDLPLEKQDEVDSDSFHSLEEEIGDSPSPFSSNSQNLPKVTDYTIEDYTDPSITNSTSVLTPNIPPPIIHTSLADLDRIARGAGVPQTPPPSLTERIYENVQAKIKSKITDPFKNNISDPIKNVMERIKKTATNIETGSSHFAAASEKINDLADYIREQFSSIPSFNTIFTNLFSHIKDFVQGNIIQIIIGVVTFTLLLTWSLSNNSQVLALSLWAWIVTAYQLLKVLRAFTAARVNTTRKMAFNGINLLARSDFADIDDKIDDLVGTVHGSDDHMFAKSNESISHIPSFLFKTFTFIAHCFTDAPISFFVSRIGPFLEILKKLKEPAQTLNTLIITFKHLRELWTYFSDSLHIYFYGYPSSVTAPEIQSLLKYAFELSQLDYQPNSYLSGVYPFVIKQVEELITVSLKSSQTALCNTLINLKTSLEKKMHERAQKEFTTRKGHMPPFCLIVEGKSNLGKSTTLLYLANAMAKAITGRDDPSAVYNRVNDGRDFYDGYKNNIVLFSDDVWTMVPIPGAIGDSVEIIKWINFAPYHLNMAKLEDKELNYMSSPIVILTTNQEYPFQKSLLMDITNEEAINNRMHVVLRAISKDQHDIGNGVFEIKKDANGDFGKPEDADKRKIVHTRDLLTYMMNQYYTYYNQRVKINNLMKECFDKQIVEYSEKEGVLTAEAYLVYTEMKCTYAIQTDDIKKLMSLYDRILKKTPNGLTILRPLSRPKTDDPHIRTWNVPIYDLQIFYSLTTEEKECLTGLSGFVPEIYDIKQAILTRLLAAKRRLNPLADVKIPVQMSTNFITEFSHIDYYSLPPSVFQKVCSKISVKLSTRHDCEVTGGHCRSHRSDHLDIDDLRTLNFFGSEFTPDTLDTCPFYHIETLVNDDNDFAYIMREFTEFTQIDYNQIYDWDTGKITFPTWASDSSVLFCANVFSKILSQRNICLDAPPLYQSFFLKLFPKITLPLIIPLIGFGLTMVGLYTLFKKKRKEDLAIAQSSDPRLQPKYHVFQKPMVKPSNTVIQPKPNHIPMTIQSSSYQRMVADFIEEPMYARVFSDFKGKTDTVAKNLVPCLLNQQCKIYVKETNIEVLNVLFIDAQTFWMSHHAIPDVEGKTIVFDWPCKGPAWSGYEIKWSDIEYTVFKDFQLDREVDLILCQMKGINLFPGIKTIDDKFMPKEKFVDLDGQRALLIVFTRTKQNTLVPYLIGIDTMTLVSEDYIYYRDAYYTTKFVAPQSLRYNYSGEPGDCSSALILISAAMGYGYRILGAHTAGKVRLSDGLSLPISREQLVDARARLALKCPKPITYADPPFGNDYVGDLGIKIGTHTCMSFRPKRVDLPFSGDFDNRIVIPRKNTIIPSPLQELNITPVYKYPAILNIYEEDGKLIDPIDRSLSKAIRPIMPVDPDILEIATVDYIDTMLNAGRYYVEPRTLTNEEVFFGNKDDEHITSLEVKTSSGYSYCVDFPGEGKKPFFNLETQTIAPITIKLIKEEEDALDSSIIQNNTHIDYMKMERRVMEKILLKKTRLFSSSDVITLATGKKLYGAWISYMMHNRVDNEQCIGINPYSKQWHDLAEYLKTHGDENVKDGDFEDYDASLNLYIMNMFPRVVNAWYKNCDGNDHRRTMWFLKVRAARHCVSGWFYYLLSGNPSGNALTPFINGIVGSISFRYIFYKSAFAQGFHTYAFRNYVKLAMFGDDNVINVAPAVHSFFNPEIISREYSLFGMKYTAADKTKSTSEFKRLQDCTFLKRGFAFDELFKVYKAPLCLHTILDTPNWTFEKVTRTDRTAAVEVCIRELALHPKEVFEYYAPRLKAAIRNHRAYAPLVSLSQPACLAIACSSSSATDHAFV